MSWGPVHCPPERYRKTWPSPTTVIGNGTPASCTGDAVIQAGRGQDHPQLTVQNLGFIDGNSTGASPDMGGAICARGASLKVVNQPLAGSKYKS